MNNLLYSIAEDLLQAETPLCTTDYGERVVMLVFSKTPITCVGNVPTYDEFLTAYEAGTCAFVKGITNGHRTFLSETEIEWHNTEWYDKTYRVEGKIKLVSEAVARMCEKINRYHELYFYYITEKEHCFGPYEGWPNFTLIQMEGKLPSYIQFNVDFIGNGIDYSLYSSSYHLIPDALITIDTEGGEWFETEDGEKIIVE
jgi:hypothetical protein